MKNQPAWRKYPKVAHVPWVPTGTHQVQATQFVFKSKPLVRIQLIVQCKGTQYRAAAFYGTSAYSLLLKLRTQAPMQVQLTVQADRQGTHVIQVMTI